MRLRFQRAAAAALAVARGVALSLLACALSFFQPASAGTPGVCWEGLDAARDFAALEGRAFAPVDWGKTTAADFRLDKLHGFYFGSPPPDKSDTWHVEDIYFRVPHGATSVVIQYSG